MKSDFFIVGSARDMECSIGSMLLECMADPAQQLKDLRVNSMNSI